MIIYRLPLGHVIFELLREAKLLHFLHEHLGGLECGDLVLGDYDGGVLRDIACGLGAAGLHDEAAEAAEINILAVCEGILNDFHELFDSLQNSCLLYAGGLGDFVYEICFCHYSPFLSILLNSVDFKQFTKQH